MHTRLKKPEFQKKYRIACRELMKDSTAAVQSQMMEAVNVMAEVMNEKKNSPQVRLNAADSIIRHGIRLTEQANILERLDDLERRIEGEE